MRSNDFSSNVQQDDSNRKYFSSETSSIKRHNPKQNSQESSHIKYPLNFTPSHHTQANIHYLKVNSDICKLQAFIVPSVQIKYKDQELQTSRQKSRKFIQFESLPLNIYAGRQMKDILTKKSSQILLNLKKNMYKSHYSKINRNKQQIEKRSVIAEQQKIGQLKTSKEQFSEEKLYDKYRRLVQKKDKERNTYGSKQNYQMKTISTNQVPTSKQMFVSLGHKVKPNQKIENKVNRIFSRPVEMQQIKQILLCNSEKTVKMHEQDIIKSIILSKTKKGDMRKQFIDGNTNKQINFPKAYSLNNDKGYSDPLKFRQTKLKTLKLTNQRESVPKNVASNNPIQTKQKIITFAPPKNISSSAFIIYEVINIFPSKNNIQINLPKRKQYPGKIHLSLNMKTSSQIASLTKIMTCIIAIQICVRYSINTLQEKYKIGLFQSFIKGTSAGIQPGQIYTIDQLLHGLMLPSGNDASLALARWGGNVLLINDHELQRKRIQELCSKSLPQTWALGNKFMKYKEQKLKAKRCYNRFIAEMNKKSRLLNMQRTIYVNSHGLSNHLNKSCCIDLALLCAYVMRNEYFRKIVSCKQYNAIIDKQQLVTEKTIKRNALEKRSYSTNDDPEQMNLCDDIDGEQFWNKSDLDEEEQSKELQKRMEYTKRQISWTNTHRLLHKKTEYIGIKTGVTVTAGACLASYLAIQQRKFIIIVLNSKKLSERFVDTQILRHWLMKKEKLGKKYQQSERQTEQIKVQLNK